MVASANIKTPSMTIPFLNHVSEKEKDSLRITLNKVTLANVLEAVHVTEKVQMSFGSRKRLVKMRFEFLPRKQYKDQVSFSLNYPSKILLRCVGSFLKVDGQD